MNSQILYDAITNISDQYIEEADPQAGSGRMAQLRRIRPYLNMAAVLLVVIGISAAAIDMGLLGRAESEAPAADAAIAEYSLQTKAAFDASADDAAVETEAAVLFRAEASEDSMPVPEPEAIEEAETDSLVPENEMMETVQMDTPAAAAGDAGISFYLDLGYPETVAWNENVYTLQSAVTDEIPEETEEADTSEFEDLKQLFSNLEIMISLNGDVIYLSFEDGWLVYEK